MPRVALLSKFYRVEIMVCDCIVLTSSLVFALLNCIPVTFFYKSYGSDSGRGQWAIAEKAAKISGWHVKRKVSNYLVSGFEGVVVVQHRVPHFDFVQLERLVVLS